MCELKLVGNCCKCTLAFLFFEIFVEFSFLLSISTGSINKWLPSVKCISMSVRTSNMVLLTASIKSSEECEFLIQSIFSVSIFKLGNSLSFLT